MATAETARLIASLELQDKNFTRGIKQVEKGVDRVDRKLGAFSGFVNRNLGRAVDTLALRIFGSVGTGLEEMATLEDAATSVAGAISQVGPSWTTTSDDIVAAANRIESETDAAFDDKAIVGATETLIRYGKVSENNLVPAMEVMTDLAARTGDVDSAASLLAKALADPEKAAGKLARSGVVLTKQQQKQIKAMVKAGDVAGAQTFLLQELAKTTSGAAAASAGPYRDALNKLGDAGEDLRRGFVTGLAPAILEVSDLLTTELAKPSTIQTLKDVGKEVGGALKGIIGIAKSLPWASIGNAMKLAGTGAKAVLDAFLGLPPWVQTAVLTGWGLNKISGGFLGQIASGLIKGVLGMNAGVVNINAGVVNGAGGVPGAAGGGVLGKLTKGGGLFGGLPKGGLGALLGITGVGLAAALASEFEDEISGVGTAIGQGWRDFLKTNVNIDVPKIDSSQLEWPFGPKNTPAILPEVFGGNGLLGGTPAAPAPSRGGDRPSPGNPGLVKGQLEQAITPTKQAIVSSVKNAQSIATRENSAQKTELQNIKNTATTAAAAQAARDVATQGRVTAAGQTTASASRGAGDRVTSSVNSQTGALVRAIWGAAAAYQPVVQSTNVVNNYTVAQRGGATSDSRTRGGV